jgi:hypothetical protein
VATWAAERGRWLKGLRNIPELLFHMALSPNRVGDVYVAITARNLRQTPVQCVTSECFGVLDQVCEARCLKCLGEKLWPAKKGREGFLGGGRDGPPSGVRRRVTSYSFRDELGERSDVLLQTRAVEPAQVACSVREPNDRPRIPA